ncbi:MAG TPA: CoA transferase [Burkholderiales bacterium]|nr:CoA transferase [Burkholderiales bacterium]
MSGPLEGVRIIDLTSVILGPYATQILGDLGADVIKIEPPEGDNMRHGAPMRSPGMGHIFLHLNRNKRSLVLDLKQAEGREAVLRLAASADVLVYNVRPQAMARLRLTYDDVRAVNKRIIYVGSYGFSQDGPYAAKPAYDDLIQGAVALPTLMQRAGADRPRFVPSTMADRITGLNTVNAVTTALYYRERSGRGQAVEVPMFESLTQFMLGDHMAGETFEPAIGPMGYARLLAPDRNPYATSDGYLCLLVYNDKQWRSFFKLIGREQMFEGDQRFSTQTRRSEHIAEIYAFVAAEVRTRTTAAWLEALTAADIPVMPLNTPESLLSDEHLKQTGFIKTVEHPTEGRLRSMAVPSRWSVSPPGEPRPAPRLGEHSVEVLREAGYSDSDIERMIAAKVTRQPSLKSDEE